MKSFIYTLLFATTFFVSCNTTSFPAGDVSAVQFEEILKTEDDYILLDIRTPEETQGGMIENAIVKDFFSADFQDYLKGLDKDKTILVYCAGGGRSGQALKTLQAEGFPKCYNLVGGYNGWKKYKRFTATQQ